MTSTPAPTVWLNVTTSSNWRRPAVGVVRLETMLTEELPKLLPEGRFDLCVWRECEFVRWHAPPSGPTTGPAVAAALPCEELIYPALPPREAIVAIIQGGLSLLPRSLRPSASRFLRGLRARVEGMLQRAERLRARPPNTIPGGSVNEVECRPGCLTPGDTLISVGLDWDHDYYRAFVTLRNQHRIRIVTCCYDLIPLLFPQYVVSNAAEKFAGYFIDLAEASEAILCISRRSEKDLQDFLNLTGARPVPTRVIPLGDTVPGHAGEISGEVGDLAGDSFILFVSTIERRKNHDILYKAYHLLCRDRPINQLPHLVFVGMPGWGVADLLKDIELDPVTKGRIHFLHHVSDIELALLYENALFCVYPSLYEGWGLPVAEALAMGKPVLASACGSLPEVGDNLVRYLDPWNAKEWADAIWEWSNDKALLRETAERIQSQYTPRTWTATAKSVKAVIDEILATDNGRPRANPVQFPS